MGRSPRAAPAHALHASAATDPGIALNRTPHRSGLFASLLSLDIIVVLATWTTALSFRDTSASVLDGAKQATAILGLTVATVIALASQHLYRSRVAVVRSLETVLIARATALVLAAALIVGRVSNELPVRTVLGGGVALFFMLELGRSAFSAWMRSQRRHGYFMRPVLLVGTNDEALRIAEIMSDHPELGYSVTGVVGDREHAGKCKDSPPWLGPTSAALVAARTLGVTGVVIAPSAVDPAIANDLVREFLRQGIHVQMTSGVAGIDQRRLLVQHLMHEPVIYVESATQSSLGRIAKRLLDVVGSTLILILMAPVMLVVAIGVRSSGPGNVVFRQVRCGRFGTPFTMYKFRTMRTDAERVFADVRDNNERIGPLFKCARDPRVTRIGKVLRSTSLDELPQILNVLRGEMSLVGPRPALPEEVAVFDAELLRRMTMLPGITGLWQVEARDNPSFAAYRRLDLFYIENWSLGLDFAILARTAFCVVGRGAASILRRGFMHDSVIDLRSNATSTD